MAGYPQPPELSTGNTDLFAIAPQLLTQAFGQLPPEVFFAIHTSTTPYYD